MAQSYSSQPEQVIPEPVSVPEVSARRTVNWPHVWAYIGLSFGLTWLIDLVLYLNGGLKHPGAGLILQFQMLMPAFAALLLGVFFFRESLVYHKTNHTASRWFIYYYFLMTFAYLVMCGGGDDPAGTGHDAHCFTADLQRGGAAAAGGAALARRAGFLRRGWHGLRQFPHLDAVWAGLGAVLRLGDAAELCL